MEIEAGRAVTGLGVRVPCPGSGCYGRSPRPSRRPAQRAARGSCRRPCERRDPYSAAVIAGKDKATTTSQITSAGGYGYLRSQGRRTSFRIQFQRGDTPSPSRGAFASEVCIFVCPPRKLEGVGKTGCLLHPRSRVPIHTAKGGTRAYRAAGTLRPSLRNGFTAYFVLFPENGSFASVAAREVSPLPDFSASTAAPEPHDFAVRFRRVRLSRPQRPPHLTARS